MKQLSAMIAGFESEKARLTYEKSRKVVEKLSTADFEPALALINHSKAHYHSRARRGQSCLEADEKISAQQHQMEC